MSGSECSGCYQTQKKTGYGQPVRAKTNSDEDLRKRTQDHQNPGFQLISNHNLQATVETNQFSNCRIRGGEYRVPALLLPHQNLRICRWLRWTPEFGQVR